MSGRHRIFAGFRKRKTLHWNLMLLGVLALAVPAVVLNFPPKVKRQDESARVSAKTTMADADFPRPLQLSTLADGDANQESRGRPIYPYSIIPGGIRSVEELQEAIAHDPLVKAHYRGFNLARAHLILLPKDRAVHVSYRREGRIYWTLKTVTLHKGEKLITDGRNIARTRCGNLIADDPTPPIFPQEPPPAVFDSPVPPPPPPRPSPPPVPIPIVPIFPGPPHPRLPATEPDVLYLLIGTLPGVWLIRKKRGSLTSRPQPRRCADPSDHGK